MLATILANVFFYMTIGGFALTVFDRILAAATKKREKPIRLPEKLLLGIAFLFGGIGVMLGFFLARRDLYTPETRLGVPAVALGETILLFWTIPGFWAALATLLGLN